MELAYGDLLPGAGGGSQRPAILSIAALFVAGFALLGRVQGGEPNVGKSHEQQVYVWAVSGFDRSQVYHYHVVRNMSFGKECGNDNLNHHQ